MPETTPLQLRQLRPDDWRLWRRVRLTSLADVPDAFGSTLAREQAYTEDDWRRLLSGGTVVVVLDGEEAVACGATFSPEAGVAAVVAMWVDPGYRGRGLSRRVLDRLLQQVPDDSRVEIGVNRSNPGARAAYLAYGFRPTGRTHPLRPGSDQVCDVLELPGSAPPA